MPTIVELDQATINQIAAGEVIERPASVVKELLENAIDAGATAVTVETKDGGISLIRVTDNGCGIEAEQIPLAFHRHTTSKIRQAIDLMTVTSLGFRGEALSSIAAVAQVELITKTSDAVNGTSYRIEGGEEKENTPIGAPDGTTMLVRNLFFNTPARRKFLKSPATEGSYIADLVQHMALSHPDVSIRLIQNGQTKLNTSGNGKLKDIIYATFGREIAANVLPVSVDLEEEQIQIHGFLGKPVISRGNRTFEYYFINGRYIHSRLIAKAIEDAYKPFMMQHRYPFVVLHLTIPAAYLDVNVHPTKMELRFRKEEALYQVFYQTIRAGLEQKEFIPEVSLVKEEEAPAEKGRIGAEPFERKALSAERLKELANFGEKKDAKPVFSGNRFYTGVRPDAMQVREQTSAYRSGFSGNASPSYQAVTPAPKVSVSAPAKTAAAASAAASESMLPFETPAPAPAGKAETEAAMPQQVAQESVQQPVQEPQDNRNLQLSAADFSGKEETAPQPEQLDLFDGRLLSEKARAKHRLIGQLFDTYWLIQYEDKLFIMDQHAAHEKVLYERNIARLKDRTGNYSQAISPPVILTVSDREMEILKEYHDSFYELGYEISYFGGKEYAISAIPSDLLGLDTKKLFIEILDGLVAEGQLTPETLLDKAASISCKAAVKGNHAMSFEEADALIDQLMTLENPYACPHGRPTLITMSRYELEKKFKRIV